MKIFFYKLTLLIFGLMSNLTSYAYDFEVNGFAYNITSASGKNVEITYKTSYNYITPVDDYAGEITIPSKVDYNGMTFTVSAIGTNAFNGCKNLKKVTIPNSITKIGNGAFLYSGIENIDIPNSVTSIGESVFLGCTQLLTYKLPESISRLPRQLFSGCNFETITINKNINRLGYICFYDNPKLEEITFEGDVIFETWNSYGSLAFDKCPIKKIIYLGTSPKPLSNVNVFDGLTYINATLYVRKGYKSVFENTYGWNEFLSIVEIDTDEQIPQYTFNVNTSVGGSVSVLGNNFSNTSLNSFVNEGDDVTLSFTPDNGYELNAVYVNDVNVINDVKNNDYKISNITQNTNVIVSFSELPVYLTIKNADNASISQEVEKGKKYNFIITPSEGWSIESVSFNGNNVTSQLNGNKYSTPYIVSDSELNIVYRQNIHTDVKKEQSECYIYASLGKIKIKNTGEAKNLSIYLVSGNKVMSESIESGTKTIELPINNIYILRIGNETFKVSM